MSTRANPGLPPPADQHGQRTGKPIRPERQASGETGTSSISRDTTTAASALTVSRPSIRYQGGASGAAPSVRPPAGLSAAGSRRAVGPHQELDDLLNLITRWLLIGALTCANMPNRERRNGAGEHSRGRTGDRRVHIHAHPLRERRNAQARSTDTRGPEGQAPHEVGPGEAEGGLPHAHGAGVALSVGHAGQLAHRSDPALAPMDSVQGLTFGTQPLCPAGTQLVRETHYQQSSDTPLEFTCEPTREFSD